MEHLFKAVKPFNICFKSAGQDTNSRAFNKLDEDAARINKGKKSKLKHKQKLRYLLKLQGFAV